MQNSQYAPTNQLQYSSKDLNLDFKGYEFTITKGTVQNCDILVNDDSLIEGGRVIGLGVAKGDKVSCQVVDKDNILGYGAGVVLKAFVANWFLVPCESATQPTYWDFSANYPAKLFAGLYIRIIYTSVGTTDDAWLAVNVKLHKILW